MLPNNDNSFPPKHLEKQFKKMKEHAAWYSGDMQALLDVFVNANQTEFASGRFWKEQKTNEMNSMIHVPIASDIAAFSADMLFGDGLKTEYESDKATDDRLEEIKEESGFDSKLIEAAESAAAIGGIFLKPNWNIEYADYPFMTVIQQDNCIPIFENGFLVGLMPFFVIKEDGWATYRLVERHYKGGFQNALFKGDAHNFGSQVKLTSIPETKNLKEFVEYPPEMKDVFLPEYVPNKMPNRLHRGSPMGQSDYAGLESLFDSLDSVYTSWIRDVENGRGRIIVPEMYLDNVDGKLMFDKHQETFVALDMDTGGMEKNPITISQFEIRTDEHMKAAYEFMSTIINTAGYAPQSFGLNLDGGISTQSHEIRERKTMKTMLKKQRHFKAPLQRVLQKMLMIDNLILGNKQTKYDELPIIEFERSLVNDIAQTVNSVNMLTTAQSASIDTRVRMLHPDWTEEQIKEEIEAIKTEFGIGQTVDSPINIGGKPVPVDLEGGEEEEEEQPPGNEEE